MVISQPAIECFLAATDGGTARAASVGRATYRWIRRAEPPDRRARGGAVGPSLKESGLTARTDSDGISGARRGRLRRKLA
jgi:hypothetical protein